TGRPRSLSDNLPGHAQSEHHHQITHANGRIMHAIQGNSPDVGENANAGIRTVGHQPVTRIVLRRDMMSPVPPVPKYSLTQADGGDRTAYLDDLAHFLITQVADRIRPAGSVPLPEQTQVGIPLNVHEGICAPILR